MGADYEQLAVDYLLNKGYNIIACNFRCRIGEIDIIACDNNYIVFIEVKYRKDGHMGEPGEAVDAHKQNKIFKVAQFYLIKNRLGMDTPCRFDVILIKGNKIEHIKNAFGCM
ncbi:MAG: YraN family protein [Eubacterium sp.]